MRGGVEMKTPKKEMDFLRLQVLNLIIFSKMNTHFLPKLFKVRYDYFFMIRYLVFNL